MDVSVVITAHREGIIAGITGRSCLQAVERASASGLRVELLVVLDRSDLTTGDVLRSVLGRHARFFPTDFGDPGQARNFGSKAASGLCCTFLDADDLWSENWLVEGWRCLSARPDACFHSAVNVVFGLERNLWWHIDSEGPLFDVSYLRWANYWDAMSFARTDLYRRFPFKANDLSLGFGHEDWHWNVATIAAGVPHKPVPQTIHFKRRRAGSQMARVEQSGSVVWPIELG